MVLARRVAACGVAVAVALGAGAAAAQRKWGTPASADAEQGRKLVAQGDCPGAIAAFDKALEVEPDQAQSYRDRGLCHEKLGHPQPAIADYREYLSRLPNAPDRPQITARLSSLEATNEPPVKTPEHGEAPATTSKQPQELEDPFAFEVAEKRKKHPVSRRRGGRGFLLGPEMTARGWSSAGFGSPTLGFGGYLGWSYAYASEVGVRALYLQTGQRSDAFSGSGWSIAAIHTWSLELAPAWGLAVGLGVGYESQLSKTRNQRNMPFGLLEPRARWTVSQGLMLVGGAEVGAGSLSASADESQSFVFYYGGGVGAVWRIGDDTVRTKEERLSDQERSDE